MSSLATVLNETPAIRATARIDIPSTSMIWTRLALPACSCHTLWGMMNDTSSTMRSCEDAPPTMHYFAVEREDAKEVGEVGWLRPSTLKTKASAAVHTSSFSRQKLVPVSTPTS